jgi:hypothetical protein
MLQKQNKCKDFAMTKLVKYKILCLIKETSFMRCIAKENVCKRIVQIAKNVCTLQNIGGVM